MLLARLAAARADANEETPEVIRWLDRQLIKLVFTHSHSRSHIHSLVLVPLDSTLYHFPPP